MSACFMLYIFMKYLITIKAWCVQMNANIVDAINPQGLGKLLQQARKQQGFTQADSAAAIGGSRTTMTAIEAGQRQIKSSELIKLAGSL